LCCLQGVVLAEFHLGNAGEAEKPLRSHVEKYEWVGKVAKIITLCNLRRAILRFLVIKSLKHLYS